MLFRSFFLPVRKFLGLTLVLSAFLFLCFVVGSIFSAAAHKAEPVPLPPTVHRAAPLTLPLQTITTLLALRFENNSFDGEQGETPTQAASITFQGGISGQGVYMDRGNRLTYPSDGNLNSTEGTIELWLKPSWNGNDGQNHTILRYGTGNGYMVLGKEANNLRLALNRANENGSLELDVFTSIENWQANQWHHVAASWSNTAQSLRLYLDGTLVSERSFVATLPTISSTANPTFQLGGDSVRFPLLAIIDDVNISDGARSSQEIASRMLQSVAVTSPMLTPNVTSVDMYPGWTYWQDFKYLVTSNVGTLALPWQVAGLTSSNPAIATIDSLTGRPKAVAPGTATITASFNGLQSVITINVLTPKKAVTEETIDPYLSTSAAGLYKIPVAIIRYFPTKDGTNVDATASGYTSTLDALRTKQTKVEKKLKFMLEEGSRFRGYVSTAPPPSLGYRVVKIINVYEDIPPGSPTSTSGVYFPDYKQILKRLNAEDLVVNQGVKEIWLEQYVNGRIALDESNMASPVTGDVSNSLRTNDDLPVYAKSYTVFGINFAQSENNAARSRGHHLEALLTYANVLQDGDDLLLQESFIGRDSNGAFLQGRCGKTDRPPNSTSNYDFNNTSDVDSDIEDWFPDGRGTRKAVNSSTWGNLTYAWPETPDGKTEGQWYIYWMQALPGLNNAITRLESERMTNWWQFAADWDSAMQTKLGLTEALSCQYSLSSTSRSVLGSGTTGSINVTCGANCKWFATASDSWIKLTNITGIGNGTVNYTVDPTTVARTGTIIIGGQIFMITQSNCTYELTPATQTISASSGTASVSVKVTGSGSCSWTATSNASWFVIASGGSGTANGTINFTVAANTGPARTATVTVADQTVTITQSSGCTYTLVPTSRNMTAAGGADSVSVQTGTGCTWTAVSNATAWLTITSGNSGTGNGTVALTVGINTGAARTGTLTIGGQTYTVMQAAANPVPTATSLSPTTVTVGSAAFTLTVNGTNFNNTSVVNWNGAARTTTFVSGTQLQAAITAADVASTGTASVTVTNPAPGGGTTSALSLPINNPAPTLTSLNPTSVIAGSAGIPLTLNGTGFVAASVAQVNSSNRTTTFVSSTQLTINLTASDIANAATMTLVVVNPAPGGGTSGQQTFTINNPAPTLSGLSQTSTVAGGAAFTLTVNGTNFVSGSKVRWNGTDRTTTFLTSTQLSASITTADIAAAGTANVTVFNAAPGGGTSTALAFTITAPCTYSLNPTSQNFTATGGNGSLSVTAGTGCNWAVTSPPAWVTINTGASGSGNGTVTFTVAANTGAARSGTLTIAGKTFTITQDAPAACTAQRSLPTTYLPGQAVQISVQVTPGAGTQSYALEEVPPTGWTISGIDNSGQFDAVNGKVKWGPFFDAQARTLNYTATPPANATGTRNFSGTVSTNGVNGTVCGKTSIDLGSLSHPADLNDNFRLEINELTAYGSAWKAGTTWSRAPNPIDINYLTNAGLLWKVGELYHYDLTKTPPYATGASAENWLPQREIVPASQRVSSLFASHPAMAAYSGMSYLPIGGMLVTMAEAVDAVTQESLVAEPMPEAMVDAVEEESLPDDSASAAWAPLSVASGTATASINAANYMPGVGVTITIVVTPDAATQVYAVEETPPLNWVISNISQSGAFDSANKKVKWGPFFDNAARTLTYIATPPAGETGSKTFAGFASFDGGSVAITGTRALSSLTCTYALSASSQNLTSSGGTGSFTVTAPAGCGWTAMTNDGWISFTQGSGSGNGSVNFTVAANAGVARAGTITVGGQSFTVNQAANAIPTITPASALTRQQGAAATAVTIATLGDTETALGNLTVITTSVPTGISLTSLTNTNGTVSALITASCLATIGTNTIGLKVTDAQGGSALANLTVNVTSSPSCFLQTTETSSSDQRLGSVLLYSYYTSSLSVPALQNTQIRITNTHETLDTAVRLYFVDGQFSSVTSLFICLPPNQTANFLMSETDPGVTGYVIAVAVNKTSGCPTNFNFLTGGASIKLSSGHTANLGAIAIAALATNPTTCTTGNSVATLNFDGTNYARLPRMLLADSLPSLKDGTDTRLILTRIGGTLVNSAGALGTITGKIYNSSRAAQDFSFNGSTPQFSGSLSLTFPRLATRLDTFIPAGQGGWLRLWTDANIGIIGAVINLPVNLRTPRAFESGYNLPQGALSTAVSLDIPISVPTCQ